MEHSEKVKVSKQIHEKARYLRGRFLNYVAVIERDIAIILTEYFCTNDESKKEMFFTKIAEGMSLQKKKELLISIVKNDYPNYWDNNKEFLNNITEIQGFRNKLAHSIVDVSEEALFRPIDEGIGFIQWKKGSPITDQEFEDWEVKANMLSSRLGDIKRLLPFIQRE